MLKCTNVSGDQYFSKYRTNNPEEIVEKMLEETSFISIQFTKLWNCYVDLLKISPRLTIAYLESEYHVKKR